MGPNPIVFFRFLIWAFDPDPKVLAIFKMADAGNVTPKSTRCKIVLHNCCSHFALDFHFFWHFFRNENMAAEWITYLIPVKGQRGRELNVSHSKILQGVRRRHFGYCEETGDEVGMTIQIKGKWRVSCCGFVDCAIQSDSSFFSEDAL